MHFGCRYLPDEGRGQLRNVRLFGELAKRDGIHQSIISYDQDGSGVQKFGSSGPIDLGDGLELYYGKGVVEMSKQLIKVLRRRQVDVIHAHNTRVASLAAVVAPKHPLVLELHSLNELRGFKHALQGRILRRADTVVVLADAAKRYLIERWNLPESAVRVVMNGINIDDSPPHECVRQDDIVRVGYVGSFHRWQGVHDFVDALEQLDQAIVRNIEVQMVGQGPEWASVKSAVESSAIANFVDVRHTVPPSSVPDLLASLDIVVIPRPSTLATETTVPLKAFEAMAAGAAIVASDVGGLAEILSNGRNCLMYPAGDIAGLTGALEQLVRDRGLRERLQAAARQDVMKFGSWHDSAESLAAVYDSIT